MPDVICSFMAIRFLTFELWSDGSCPYKEWMSREIWLITQISSAVEAKSVHKKKICG